VQTLAWGPIVSAMPRQTLTRDQIISAAIELLDRDGLEGFNMRALGERLGSAATAVYWHVGSKENLIALAADRAWTEVPLPDLATTDWRIGATAMATGLYAMLTRHTWVVQTFGSVLVYGPGKARHDDHAIGLFEAGGFAPDEVDQAITAVFTYVIGNALGPAATASITRKLARESVDGEERMRAMMANARDIASQFPRLRSGLDSPAAEYGAAPEGSFRFGLEAILDGLVARRAAGAAKA
jgi:AcrR family transcriptional regulator